MTTAPKAFSGLKRPTSLFRSLDRDGVVGSSSLRRTDDKEFYPGAVNVFVPPFDTLSAPPAVVYAAGPTHFRAVNPPIVPNGVPSNATGTGNQSALPDLDQAHSFYPGTGSPNGTKTSIATTLLMEVPWPLPQDQNQTPYFIFEHGGAGKGIYVGVRYFLGEAYLRIRMFGGALSIGRTLSPIRVRGNTATDQGGTVVHDTRLSLSGLNLIDPGSAFIGVTVSGGDSGIIYAFVKQGDTAVRLTTFDKSSDTTGPYGGWDGTGAGAYLDLRHAQGVVANTGVPTGESSTPLAVVLNDDALLEGLRFYSYPGYAYNPQTGDVVPDVLVPQADSFGSNV